MNLDGGNPRTVLGSDLRDRRATQIVGLVVLVLFIASLVANR